MSSTITHTRTWRTPIIEGLLLFAHTTPAWGDRLAAMIRQCSWYTEATTSTPPVIPAAQPWYLPHSTEHATMIAQWLLVSPVSQSEKVLLGTFAAHREIPRDIIFFGMGMGMIPGLTIGDPSIKKKKRVNLAVIIDQATYTSLTKPALAQLAITTALATVARELRRAGGITSKLHPDTAEWLMSEPAIALFVTDRETLTTIADTARAEFILTNHLSQTSPALGLSPAVSDGFLDSFSVTRAE